MYFTLFFSVLFIATQTFADLRYTHLWYDYPADETNCQNEAERIAEEAAKAAPEIKAELGVGNMSHGRCKIELSYDYYSRPVCMSSMWSHESLYSSCPEFGSTSLANDLWQFDTLEQCQAEASDQKTLFEKSTRTHAVMAHCYLDKKIKKPVLRIVGFSSRKTEGTVKEPDVVSVPPAFQQTPAVISKITGWLVGYGNVVSRIASSPSHGGSEFSYVHYYRAPKSPAIRELFAGRKLAIEYFRGLEHNISSSCDEQLQEVESFLMKQPAEIISSYCGADLEKSSFKLHVLYAGGKSMDVEWAPYEYSNYEKCRADRARIVKTYKEKLSKDVWGLFCGKNEGKFRARLFMKPKY